MSARARRIRRQHRKWGKPFRIKLTTPNGHPVINGVLIRYLVLWEVLHDPPFGVPSVRRRWLTLNADEGYKRVYSGARREWGLSSSKRA